MTDQTNKDKTDPRVAEQMANFVESAGAKITIKILPMPDDEKQQIFVDVKQEMFPTEGNELANRIGALVGEYVRGVLPAVLPNITGQAAIDSGLYERVEPDETDDGISAGKKDNLH